MEPIFTLSYPEFCIAQQLRKAFPPSRGYSVYVPCSRQEKGVDLILTRRKSGITRVATIQVKSSRTYTRRSQTDRTQRPFRFGTWFNNFEVPKQADFFFLVAIYPPDEARTSPRMGSWWAPVIIVFSQREMRRFLRTVKTRGGHRDKMFGFGFNDPGLIIQTRGDRNRRYRDYSSHLLKRKVREIKAFLGGRPRRRAK